MKKSVILSIIVIYVASFFIVGFFGERSKVYDQKVKVESIECVMAKSENNIDTSTTENPVFKSLGETEHIAYVFERSFSAADVTNGLQVTLEFKVLPRTATNTNISYTLSRNVDDAANSASADSASTDTSVEASASTSADASTSTSAKPVKYTFKDNGDGTAVFMFYEPMAIDVLIKASDGVQIKVRVDVAGTRDYYIQYG